MRAAARGAVALAAIALSGCQEPLPPLPEVVVVVDTDLPVPLAAARLRVDLFDEQGAWFATTDVARPDPIDWPISFSVYADEGRTRRVWARFRVYPDGHTRDYRGESPRTLGGPIEDVVPASDAPRLMEGGRDITPVSEPDPLDAVDRLILLEVKPGLRRKASLVLHGACAGTSSILGADPAKLVLGEAATCVDVEKTRVPVTLTDAPADDLARGPTVAGTWLADPCPPDDGGPRVCVPGGATLLGSTDAVSSGVVSARPVRLFGARRFFLDRHEVTVGRFREVVKAGFKPPFLPVVNNKPLSTDTTAGSCTWSTKLLDREDFPLSCVAWQTARAFCQHVGGDLPSEAQWEHAATVAGHDIKVHYPWGNAAPSCDEVVFGGAATGTPLPECPGEGDLPRPLSASAGDLTPQGVVGLAGSLTEWTLDVSKPYSDVCWGDASLIDPRCGNPDDEANERVARGANYSGPMTFPTFRYVVSIDFLSTFVGFRCAYPEAP